jgi:hypothetical protein
MPETKLHKQKKKVRFNSAFSLRFSTNELTAYSTLPQKFPVFHGTRRWSQELETEPYSKPRDSSPHPPAYSPQTIWRYTLGMPHKRTSKIPCRMTICYCPAWKHSHSVHALYTLVEELDIFSLHVLLIPTELFALEKVDCVLFVISSWCNPVKNTSGRSAVLFCVI